MYIYCGTYWCIGWFLTCCVLLDDFWLHAWSLITLVILNYWDFTLTKCVSSTNCLWTDLFYHHFTVHIHLFPKRNTYTCMWLVHHEVSNKYVLKLVACINHSCCHVAFDLAMYYLVLHLYIYTMHTGCNIYWTTKLPLYTHHNRSWNWPPCWCVQILLFVSIYVLLCHTCENLCCLKLHSSYQSGLSIWLPVMYSLGSLILSIR